MVSMGMKVSERWGLGVFLAYNLIPLASAQGLESTVLDLCLGSCCLQTEIQGQPP